MQQQKDFSPISTCDNNCAVCPHASKCEEYNPNSQDKS